MADLKITIDPERPRIVMTREFDAPRELVWRAWTDPALLPRWWGPATYAMTVDVMDVRPGGEWRFVQRGDDGSGSRVEFVFYGEYREVSPPERLSYTFEFGGMPGHVSVETIVLEDLGNGRTRMVSTSVFPTLEERDGMVESGMESGAVESMDRMETLLREMADA